MRSQSNGSVLLDTGFLIRLVNQEDALHQSALSYWEYFLTEDYDIYISTIAIAEYCVKATVNSLPLGQVRILPFNITHGIEAGRLSLRALEVRGKTTDAPDRVSVTNDCKMFAQANLEQIDYFISSDIKAKKFAHRMGQEYARFQIVTLDTPCA